MQRCFRHLVPALLLGVCVRALSSLAESYRRTHWAVLLLRPSGFTFQAAAGKA